MRSFVIFVVELNEWLNDRIFSCVYSHIDNVDNIKLYLNKKNMFYWLHNFAYKCYRIKEAFLHKVWSSVSAEKTINSHLHSLLISTQREWRVIFLLFGRLFKALIKLYIASFFQKAFFTKWSSKWLCFTSVIFFKYLFQKLYITL